MEDLLDISELCKLITQRPDGEAIAHKACQNHPIHSMSC